jgi:hypothetical protein
LLCKAIANFPGSARPAPTGPNSIFRRAVYFDPTKNHPEFIWLELRKEPVGTYLYLLAVLDDLLKCKKVEHGIEYITINERTKRDLGKAIYVTFRDNFYNDGSIRNEGIRRAIDPALRNVAQEWRGPVVFYGMEDVDQTHCRLVACAAWRQRLGDFDNMIALPMREPIGGESSRLHFYLLLTHLPEAYVAHYIKSQILE